VVPCVFAQFVKWEFGTLGVPSPLCILELSRQIHIDMAVKTQLYLCNIQGNMQYTPVCTHAPNFVNVTTDYRQQCTYFNTTSLHTYPKFCKCYHRLPTAMYI